jgi:hypothetical protein
MKGERGLKGPIGTPGIKGSSKFGEKGFKVS